MTSRIYWIIPAVLIFGSPPASADDGKGRDDNRNGDRRGGHGNHGRPGRPVFIWTPGFSFYSPYPWGSAYYDPYLAEQNQAALEFQRQQARLEAERAIQANVDAQAAAAERLAALKAESKKKRAAAAAKTAARNFAAGNYRFAVSNYQDAVELVGDDASVYFMLAQSQFAIKKFFEAAKTLRTAVRVNPNLVDFDVFAFYKNAEDFRAQLTVLADELRVNPLNRDAMLLFGHMLFISGQKENAKTIFQECAKLGIEAEVLKPYFDHFLPAAAK
jgi:hypothetical protein